YAGEQPVEGDLQFQAGQVLAEALVDAEPEGDVVRILAGEVQYVGAGVYVGVAVGEGARHQHALARLDAVAGDLDVALGDPGGDQVGGGDEAQQFLDRPGQQRRVGVQQGQLLGM